MLLTAEQIRQKYLAFYKDKGHAVVPSASLVPENDPTTLFTTAGMQPMMPYLLGDQHPLGSRVVDVQKSFRAQDLEEVGDNRHTTFFEMLGNWSFGDYFMTQQLSWFFNFLVEEINLDPVRLYVTAFKGSDKYDIPRDLGAIKVWQELFSQHDIQASVVEDPQTQGLQAGRIFLYTWENWWSRAGEPKNMPPGEPGGPDSEVFYDFGPDLKLHENSEFADQPCHLNCNCGRFLEIGNSVFMKYQKTADGFKELPQKNIDFGGGLERILAANQQQLDIFKTSLFWPIIQEIKTISGQDYTTGNKLNFRVITDHIKATVMLIGDGVKPSNKDRGYVVRRLIRRAIRYGKLMDINQPFLHKLAAPVIDMYQDHYQYLESKRTEIISILEKESSKFEKTLNRGLKEFERIFDEKNRLTGQTAFHLYETYGFPIEMSVEEAKRFNIPIDTDLKQDFNQAQQKHAQQSRSGAAQKFEGGLADKSEDSVKYHTATHLLHAALRKVLGEHVQQKGSNISAERLRFDFSHPESLTQQQIKEVEELINQWIDQDLPVFKQIMDKQAAINSGALSFFAESYPNQVKVYIIGSGSPISKELCTGPHVSTTGEIGHLEIYKEKSAAAGIRRVYARLAELEN